MTETAELNVDDLIEQCREHCPKGVRPSPEEAMELIAEIDRLRKLQCDCGAKT